MNNQSFRESVEEKPQCVEKKFSDAERMHQRMCFL
jgi:hypothetical protein